MYVLLLFLWIYYINNACLRYIKIIRPCYNFKQINLIMYYIFMIYLNNTPIIIICVELLNSIIQA